MNQAIRDIGTIILVIAIVVGVAFGALYAYKYFAPRYENARREVFENTRSYNEAKLQDLVKYRLEYLKASEEDKPILAQTILHMFANYDEDRLPYELRNFLRDIKDGTL
jgi:hypothetical protein